MIRGRCWDCLFFFTFPLLGWENKTNNFSYPPFFSWSILRISISLQLNSCFTSFLSTTNNLEVAISEQSQPSLQERILHCAPCPAHVAPLEIFAPFCCLMREDLALGPNVTCNTRWSSGECGGFAAIAALLWKFSLRIQWSAVPEKKPNKPQVDTEEAIGLEKATSLYYFLKITWMKVPGFGLGGLDTVVKPDPPLKCSFDILFCFVLFAFWLIVVGFGFF